MANSSSLLKFALLLFLLHFIEHGKSIPASEFYEFGNNAGDLQMQRVLDGSSTRLQISVHFPFFDKTYDSLFVGTNGIISFGRPELRYTPLPFPLGNDSVLVAPYWSDVDLRQGGEIWYRQLTNPNILSKATSDVREAFRNQRKFTASWVFIATWYEVPVYNDSSSTTKKNSFQAVLITNGRHSFVIFNYDKITWTSGTDSGGNGQGLGGTEAECGYNAGDGKTFFSINRSNTSEILELSENSNVNKPGVWMFRVDNADVIGYGCNTEGYLTISPNSGSMLGGENIVVTGPCYEPTDKIMCKFDNLQSPGSYLSESKAKCTVPMVDHITKMTLMVSRNGGKSFPFYGKFQHVNPEEKRANVLRDSHLKWKENEEVKIYWAPGKLGNASQKVVIHIARYVLKNKVAKFHNFYQIKSQQNTGESQFIVPQYEGEGERKKIGQDRFISLVRVIKEELYKTQQRSYEWLWSDVITWDNRDKALARCKQWNKNEPDPSNYLGNTDILSCPRTLEQAFVDGGRYTDDASCYTDHYNNIDFGCELYHKEAIHCVRTIVPSESKAGQQCCYNSKHNLMVGPPSGGSLNRVHTDTGIPYISHYFSDILPYHDCCRLSSSCRAYYKKRPSDNGENYRPPRPAATFGDPHIITLDGFQYTFNGKGEYTILNIDPKGFVLQGRMEQLKDNKEIQVNATVYTAFAMKEEGSDIIQVQLKQGNTEVLCNGKLVKFDVENIIDFENVMVIKHQNISKYVVIFKSGVAVTVEGFQNLLQMLVLVPELYKGNTSGLLGFWDDDTTKELLLPNGTFLNTSSDAHTIHYEFGLKWITSANRTIFHYNMGKSFSTYDKPEFVPIFLDQENLKFEDPNLEKKARSVCGDSIQCLFDVKTTKNPSIGKASRFALTQFKTIINVTETEECAPLEPNLPNVIYQRNDSTARIEYRFKCHPNYILKGSHFVSCEKGIWSERIPTCVAIKGSGSLSTTYKVLIGLGCTVVLVVVLSAFYWLKISQKKKTHKAERKSKSNRQEKSHDQTQPEEHHYTNPTEIVD